MLLAVLLMLQMACVETSKTRVDGRATADASAFPSAALSTLHDDSGARDPDALVPATDTASDVASDHDTGAPPAGPTQATATERFMSEPPDSELRRALRNEAIARVERGRGGRSLGFKITLESGQRGYFKPEQTFSAANWFGEVAAYHLDRMLGIGRVPCVASREFEWKQLVAAAGNDARKSEVVVHDGKVHGAFVSWVTGDLKPLRQEFGWERWIRVKYWPSTSVTPFQRPAVWKHQLDLVRQLGDDWRSKEERYMRRNLNPEPDREDRPRELSDMIVFDYLTRNMDRWGGDNVNVLTRGVKGPLVFLDNGAGFEPGEPRPSLMEARLHALQRFRRSTIASVRSFDRARYEARLAEEAVQPVLTNAQLDALMARRKGLLDWVSEMESIHGDGIWAWE